MRRFIAPATLLPADDRREGPTMTIITTVRFSHPDMALADTIGARPDATIRVVPEAGTDPEHDTSFFLAEGDGLDDLEDVLAADHTVRVVYLASRHGDQQVFGVQFAPETVLLAPRVTEGGGIALEARTTADGWVERWQLPDRSVLHDIWRVAREESFDFEIQELHRTEATSFGRSFGLTDEQREAILLAHRAGYFAEPRQASLEEVAERLQISTAAAGGRLRRGIEKLVRHALVEDD